LQQIKSSTAITFVIWLHEISTVLNCILHHPCCHYCRSVPKHGACLTIKFPHNCSSDLIHSVVAPLPVSSLHIKVCVGSTPATPIRLEGPTPGALQILQPWHIAPCTGALARACLCSGLWGSGGQGRVRACGNGVLEVSGLLACLLGCFF